MYWVFKLLPKLHPTLLRTADPVFQTSQGNIQVLCTNKFGRFHKPEETPRKFLPIGPQTTTKALLTHSHVRR